MRSITTTNNQLASESGFEEKTGVYAHFCTDESNLADTIDPKEIIYTVKKRLSL